MTITVDPRALVLVLAAACREDAALARELRDALGADDAAELVTVAEYAIARSISTSTVRAAIREKRLDVVRIGRAVRVRRDAGIAPRSGDDVTSVAERRLGLVRGGRR